MLDLIEILQNKLRVCPFLWAYSISLSIYVQLVVSILNHFIDEKISITIFELKLKKTGGFGCAVGCYAQLIIFCYVGSNAKETVN